MSTTENVAILLQHLVTLPDICLVLGLNEAICELFAALFHLCSSISY